MLETIQKEATPMRQVVKAVKASYGTEAPNKTTIWRAIKKLQAEGMLEARAEKVIREYTEYWLSTPELPPIDFDEEFTAQKQGEKLRMALQARETLNRLSPPPTRLKPLEALSRRSEGELAALAETARISFNALLKPLDERSYKLR